MKTYKSRATKWLAILATVSIAVLVAGIICILTYSSGVGLQIGLTMFGGLMSILFLSCFFAEKSRCLTIDAEKIILPRGAETNGKFSFQKTVIHFDKIYSIKSELCKGDGIISKDTLFYIWKLKDENSIYEWWHYGCWKTTVCQQFNLNLTRWII